MTQFPPSEFWDFSLDLYAKAEVAAPCLRLQERHGVDVNVLLFCMWMAVSGRGRFREGELARALGAVDRWHAEVVRHLRTLRKRLKDDVEPVSRALAEEVRRRVAATEIDAEHVEQLVLAGTLDRPPRDAGPIENAARAAAGNLADYFEALGVRPGSDDRADARILLGAAFPGIPPTSLDLPGLTERGATAL